MSELSNIRERARRKATLEVIPAYLKEVLGDLVQWKLQLEEWELNLQHALEDEQDSYILYCRQKINNISEIIEVIEQDARQSNRLIRA